MSDQAVNTIKFLAVDAIEQANSGHPGLPMGCADFAHVLMTRFLRVNPDVPDWTDRDRFVLSAGHGSMLLYSMLHLLGFDVSMPSGDVLGFPGLGLPDHTYIDNGADFVGGAQAQSHDLKLGLDDFSLSPDIDRIGASS